MPKVSIIIPCYNEDATIGDTLSAIHGQTFPRAEMEVVISDSMSTDRTRAVIAEFQGAHPDLAVRVVENAARVIPAALNRAIEAARGEIIVRMDAHSKPYPDYVENCVRALDEGRGANVGGAWEIQPGALGWVAAGIAAAASHPLGAGDAAYRLRPEAGAVDTVPFGAYRKSLIEEVGAFDESLLSNEDYEFNVRVRRAGKIVWLDPRIRSVYYARSDFGALVKQYWRYGFWKARMLRRYPETLRWRQFLPPVFVASVIFLLAFSFWLPARILLAVELSAYLFVLLAAGIHQAAKRGQPALVFSFPVAVAAIHFSWGAGLLYSLFASLGSSNG
ncbi:MAG: glycosyltransferase family 2 protein [Anaerolineaceae bacterium]|nr:MAG: glycosyltransferase family 2 protein [Anaerolineaceae bacterium]